MLFKEILKKELPLLTLVMTDLGNVMLTPNGAFAQVCFPSVELVKLPTGSQIDELKRELIRKGGIRVSCELSERKLQVTLGFNVPKFFPVLRVRYRLDAIINEVESWLKPFSLSLDDRVLGTLRLCGWCYEGRLNQGQSDVETDMWIDVFIEAGEQPVETELNLHRTSQFVESWLNYKSRIEAELLGSIYPEYHRYCDECEQKIRHDEAGFWKQLSIVSITGKLDGAVVVRYHSGDLFGERRVESTVHQDRIACEVVY